MQKEKFHIEYIFDKVSNHSLWNHLTTPRGLSSWFADDVNIHSQTYTFTWRKVQEQAVVIKLEPEVCIRFHWVDDEEAASYFEFIIHHIGRTRSSCGTPKWPSFVARWASDPPKSSHKERKALHPRNEQRGGAFLFYKWLLGDWSYIALRAHTY